MTFAIVAQLPVYGSFVSDSRKALAHKKLAGEALTALEKFRHAAFMCNQHYKSFYEGKLERIHPIGGALLFDSTLEACARVCSNSNGHFTLFGHHLVARIGSDLGWIMWGKLFNTDYAVVRNGKKEGELVVVKHETTGQEVTWHINTRLLAYAKEEPVFLMEMTPVRTEPADPRAEALVASFPVDDSHLLDEHKRLINRVVSEVEGECDFARALSGQSAEYKVAFEQVVALKRGRVLHAEDPNVRIYNCVPNLMVSVGYSDEEKGEFLCFNGIKVRSIPFCSRSVHDSSFSRGAPAMINYVSILPAPRYRDWVQVEMHFVGNFKNPGTFYVNLAQVGRDGEYAFELMHPRV